VSRRSEASAAHRGESQHRITATLVALAVLAVCLVSACSRSKSGDDGEAFFLDQERSGFAADADADVYSGPAPLTVQFTARTGGATGAVSYRWNFDDHATAEGQSPAHTFGKRGWYLVTMDASDSAGHAYRMNLQLHAWRPSDWNRMLAHPDDRIVRHALRELAAKRATATASASTAH